MVARDISVGASPSVASWHLRHLAQFGLVEDADSPDGDARRRWWKAASTGISVSLPDTAEGKAAARQLTRHMHAQAIGDVQRWEVESEPRLDDRRRKAVASGNTEVHLTVGELRRMERDINALLAAYTSREEPPRGARPVRIVRFLLPDPGDES